MLLQERVSSGKASETDEQAENIAFNLGLTVIGGLASEVEVAESDFDFEAMMNGFNDGMSKDTFYFTNIFMDSIISEYSFLK